MKILEKEQKNNSDIIFIRDYIMKTVKGLGASVQKIILFGSRARKDFTLLSDYDVLIITEKPFEINKKMSISKNIRQYLARSGLDVDVIIKSVNEVNILKDKPGSIVRNDLKVAEHELMQSADEIVTDAVCFHCQQAVEKLLKAYLASKNIDFGKTHNLEFLLESCLKIDPDFKDLDVGNLSFYAVEIRYHDEFYMPSVAEAKECFSIASKDKDFLLKKIS